MRRILSSTATLTLTLTLASLHSITNASDEFTSLFDIPPRTTTTTSLFSFTNNSSLRNDGVPPQPSPPRTPEEMARLDRERTERIASRRTRARQKLADMPPPDMDSLHHMSKEELSGVRGKAMESDPELIKEENWWMRGLNWGSSSGSSNNPYAQDGFADSGASYDWWQQGYRMVGAYVDCDHQTSEGSNDQGNDGDNAACSRWMIWAAYVNTEYQGNGRADYFDYTTSDDGTSVNNAPSTLDCHSSSSVDWELLGVYRQEFYQFIEQISKHLWAIDDYEYVVALAGLAYMTDADCFYVGTNVNGAYVYAAVQPTSGGSFQMGLYTDNTCTDLDDSGSTYDDFVGDIDMSLGSKDDGSMTDDQINSLYTYWQEAQEYTLALVNEVYDEYKYCTLCVDYPTYQDGYFIGDDGTDGDDLINQCWKFHSHDSYPCGSADCVAVASSQGTMVELVIDGVTFGDNADWTGTNHHVNNRYSGSNELDNVQRFKANAFLTFNGILFVATFLAFSVARGARADSRKSDKGRSLLSRDERARSDKSRASRKSRRSRSRKSGGGGGDDRTARSKESRRSKSGNRKTREGSSSRKKSRDKSRTKDRQVGPSKREEYSKV